jgi:transposase
VKTVYVGLDVHSKETVYVMQNGEGTVVAEGTVQTDRVGLEGLIEKHQLGPGTAVCLETGGQAAFVCEVLEGRGLRPVVVDAAEVRRKARRRGQKTDRRDAFELCDGWRRDQWQTRVYMPPPEIRQLRQILSRRRHFVRVSTQQMNAAKYLLRREGLRNIEGVSLTTAAGWAALQTRPELSALRGHMQLHAQTWALAQTHIETLEAELREAIGPLRAVVERLQTVPAIGPITASSYVAIVGTPERFADSNHVVSYLGLAPSMYDSGETERHGGITKAGSSAMRALLCEVAQHAARPTHPLNPYFVRVAAKHGYKKAAIAIAQRLARILYRLWSDGTDFDPTKLNVERDGRRRIKRAIWRIKPTGTVLPSLKVP